MKILVGCDPEIFLTFEGEPFSADGVIPGTKKEPFPVPGGAVQVDGMALEYNIDPAHTEDEFLTRNLEVRHELEKMVKGVRQEFELLIKPTVTFEEVHFALQSHEARELGCEPDFNAYTGETNPKPDNTTRMRTAAGHIHVGFTEGACINDPQHILMCRTLMKHLDAFLGVPSLMWDDDTKRRMMYGAAGCYRPKSYGGEYRTLSNAWLTDDDLIRYVYQQTIAAVEDLQSGRRFPADSGYDPMMMINGNSNLEDVEDFLYTEEIEMPVGYATC